MSIRACQAPRPARPPFARGASEHASGSGAADLQGGGGARNSAPPSARGRQGRGPGLGGLPHWPPPADSRDATTADAAAPRSLTGAGRVFARIAQRRADAQGWFADGPCARAVAVARFEKLVGERRTRPPLPSTVVAQLRPAERRLPTGPAPLSGHCRPASSCLCTDSQQGGDLGAVGPCGRQVLAGPGRRTRSLFGCDRDARVDERVRASPERRVRGPSGHRGDSVIAERARERDTGSMRGPAGA